MARAVVWDWFQRDWGRKRLRFDLYYDYRAYGCGARWNRQYIEWLAFFRPPDDKALVPQVITKGLLQAALESRGISCKKSDSKKVLLERAVQVPGLISALMASTCPEFQDIRPEWQEPVSKWVGRVQAIRPVGAAMLKFLGLTAIYQ
ncbi:MAG TPA: hypothetical protein VH280_19730 [Verrucomicrobiae bacterium]|jgi:hypothetical protein|nr:hypothetical protein [Verrucomicrobiae bacterium]